MKQKTNKQKKVLSEITFKELCDIAEEETSINNYEQVFSIVSNLIGKGY